MFCRCNEKEEKGFKHLILIEKNLLSLGIISSSQIFWSLYCWQFYIFTAKIFISYNALYVNIAFSKDTGKYNISICNTFQFVINILVVEGFYRYHENGKKYTAQKVKFPIKDFFSKCEQIRSFLRVWSHLPKKSLMENVIFCAVIEVDNEYPSKHNFFARYKRTRFILIQFERTLPIWKIENLLAKQRITFFKRFGLFYSLNSFIFFFLGGKQIQLLETNTLDSFTTEDPII